MAYIVKKRCVRCLKRLDDNGKCTNPECPMSKIDISTDNATETAGSEGQSE